MSIIERIHLKIIEERIKFNYKNSSDVIHLTPFKYMLSNIGLCFYDNIEKGKIQKLSMFMKSNFNANSIINNSIMMNRLYDLLFDAEQKEILLKDFEKLT